MLLGALHSIFRFRSAISSIYDALVHFKDKLLHAFALILKSVFLSSLTLLKHYRTTHRESFGAADLDGKFQNGAQAKIDTTKLTNYKTITFVSPAIVIVFALFH